MIVERLKVLARAHPDGTAIGPGRQPRDLWPLPWYLRGLRRRPGGTGSPTSADAPGILADPGHGAGPGPEALREPPPGERELYVSLFERPVELRPGWSCAATWRRPVGRRADSTRRIPRRAARRAPRDDRGRRRTAATWARRGAPGPAVAPLLARGDGHGLRGPLRHPDARYAARRRGRLRARDRLEQELSRFIGNSDVSRINALAAGETTRVSPSTLECLEIARPFTTSPAGRSTSRSARAREPRSRPGRLRRSRRDGGVRLDLGGIGKGYAVDRMAELLAEWEVPRALVHGGFSSVLALEAPPGREGWPLTLSAPGGGGSSRGSRRASGLQRLGDPEGRPHPRPAHGPARAGTARRRGLRSPATPGEGRRAMAEGLSTAFMILPGGGDCRAVS